ncbi:MAG: hypothetical protein QOG76_4659, partial [Pseudonocardiales bacterium]|nr:hypothetical protein [Pseudonocardiales bacterium]
MAKRPTSGATPARAGRVTGSRSPLVGGLGLAIGAVLFSAAMTPVEAPSQTGFVSAAQQPVVPAAMVSALVTALPSAPQPPPIPKPPKPPAPPPPPSIPPMPGLSPSAPASSI